MKLTGLSRLLAEQASYRHILKACDVPAAERLSQVLIGAVAGVQAPLIADISAKVQHHARSQKKPLTLVITPTERQVRTLLTLCTRICRKTRLLIFQPGKPCPMNGSLPAAIPWASA